MIAFKTNRKVAFAASAVALIAAGLAFFPASPALACSTSECMRTDAQGGIARQAWHNDQEAMYRQAEADASQQNANIPVGPPRPAPHSAIAYHPDASDYWIAAMYPNAHSAMVAAADQCNMVMGGGCKTVWQGSGYIGAARAANGDVYWMVNQDKGKIRSELGTWCKSFQLGCLDTSIYHSNSEFRKNRNRTGHNIRSPQDPARVRKLYAATAWLAGDGYNGKSWVASGYATAKQAQDVALNACKLRSGTNKPCEVGVMTGNGVIVSFKTSAGERFLVEQSEERGRQAVAQYCKQEKLTCKVHHVYDARIRGAFENIIP